MKTVVMAGGQGTRISKIFPDIPKPLIPISDGHISKPVLEWEIESLRQQGFTDIIFTVSYMAEKIMDYFGNGEKYGVKIEYFVEEQPLGNAGALFKLRDKLTDDFLLLNADALFDIDFNRFVAFHRAHGGLVTLFTHPNSHPFDSAVIISSENGCVERWLTKDEERPKYYKNRVNAGLHIISPVVLDMAAAITDSEKTGTEDADGQITRIDLDRHILKPLCGTGRMFVYDSPEYVKDMGTPERYEQASRDFENGVIAAKNLSHPQKAVFLDRDGTINKYVGFLRNADEFEIIDGVAEAVKRLNASGYLAILVTNQPVIARGEVTVPELQLIHDKMETELGMEGAYIDGIYYCPHHPRSGYEGEITELKIDCECRKPKPGLILKAAKDFNVVLADSWMIGDGENDVKAGQAAGCHTALIQVGNGVACDVSPDMIVDSLLNFVKRTMGCEDGR